MQQDHDHFITCEFAIERGKSRMIVIIEKLNVLLTPTTIYKSIYRGVINYYKNTKRKEEKRNTNTPIDAKEIIG